MLSLGPQGEAVLVVPSVGATLPVQAPAASDKDSVSVCVDGGVVVLVSEPDSYSPGPISGIVQNGHIAVRGVLALGGA